MRQLDPGSDVAVVGAGIAGTMAAVLLARLGLGVTVIERDPSRPPAFPEQAFDDWLRPGVPQFRHSHLLVAGLRNFLRARCPDLLADLLEAGATERSLPELMPWASPDGSGQPGDEDLIMIVCRRALLEWVLRRTLERQPAITMLNARVTGITFSRRTGGPPRAHGVSLSDGTAIGTRLCVVATGAWGGSCREWFTAGRVGIHEETQTLELAYFSRFYRIAPGRPGVPTAPRTTDLGTLRCASFPADHNTFSISFAFPRTDRRLWASLSDPHTFDTIAAGLPAASAWFDGYLSPVTNVQRCAVHAIRRRSPVAPPGSPSMLGCHLIGDARLSTNPTLGWGVGLAAKQVAALVDAVSRHPDDPVEQAMTFERSVSEELQPWYSLARAAGDPAIRRCHGAPRIPSNPLLRRAVYRRLHLVDPPSRPFEARGL